MDVDVTSVEVPTTTNKKWLILVVIGVIVILLAGLFYYLYNTYPNTPTITLQEKGYKVMAVVEFPKEEIPVGIYRSNALILNVQNAGNNFLEGN